MRGETPLFFNITRTPHIWGSLTRNTHYLDVTSLSTPEVRGKFGGRGGGSSPGAPISPRSLPSGKREPPGSDLRPQGHADASQKTPTTPGAALADRETTRLAVDRLPAPGAAPATRRPNAINGQLRPQSRRRSPCRKAIAARRCRPSDFDGANEPHRARRGSESLHRAYAPQTQSSGAQR